MKIINDQIQFEATDIAQFSVALQESIVHRAGPQTTPHEYLSARINAVLEEAVNTHNEYRLKQDKPTCLAFVRADAATQNTVKELLGVR